MESQRAIDDTRQFARSNAEFHDRLCAIGNQRTLGELITGLRNRSEVYIRLLAGMPASLTRALEEHSAIVAALARRDEDGIVEAVANHLASTVNSVSTLIDTPERETYDER